MQAGPPRYLRGLGVFRGGGGGGLRGWLFRGSGSTVTGLEILGFTSGVRFSQDHARRPGLGFGLGWSGPRFFFHWVPYSTIA